MVALFRGAHACVNRQLALPSSDVLPQLHDLSAATSTFQDWASGLDDDLDLGRDPRMMVPIFYDVERRKTKAWVVLGWEKRPLGISYETPPMVHVKDKNGELPTRKWILNSRVNTYSPLILFQRRST